MPLFKSSSGDSSGELTNIHVRVDKGQELKLPAPKLQLSNVGVTGEAVFAWVEACPS